MALSVVNNGASLNAQQNLGRTGSALSKSLERLSTGLKINRGADGPAGLVISEQQRAQISGLKTAIDNTNKAVSLAQTGEGALNELNTLLNKVRSLAIDSANSGVNEASALAANQAEITNALNTINNIANTTKFGTGKFLLNGQAGVTATASTNPSSLGQVKADIGATAGAKSVAVGAASGGIVTSGNTADNAAAAGTVIIGGGGLAAGVTVDLTAIATVAATVTAIQSALDTKAGAGNFTVTGSAGAPLVITSKISGSAVTLLSDTAHSAALTGTTASTLLTGTAGAALSAANVTSGNATGGRAAGASNLGVATLTANGTLTVAGGGLTQSLIVSLTAGDNAATIVQKVQTALDNAASLGGGLGKFTVGGTAGNRLTIQSNILGSSAITIQADTGGNTAAITGVSSASADTGASGNALFAFVDGNATTVAAGTQGLSNFVTFGGATGLTFNVGVSGGKATSGTNTVTVADNSLSFQIGANAGETVRLSIDKVTTDKLGSGVSGLVNTSTTDLGKVDVTTTSGAQDAIRIIDQAINDVSNVRAKLGAFQTNSLESNANNLRNTLENTIAAESVIRDTDFASEIANFTRLQTQQQAGATVLGNANQTTALVAQLLRG